MIESRTPAGKKSVFTKQLEENFSIEHPIFILTVLSDIQIAVRMPPGPGWRQFGINSFCTTVILVFCWYFAGLLIQQTHQNLGPAKDPVSGGSKGRPESKTQYQSGPPRPEFSGLPSGFGRDGQPDALDPTKPMAWSLPYGHGWRRG